MIRVLVADDHPVVRGGLKQILKEIPDIVEVDEASTGQEVLSSIRKKQYHIVVLDLVMPGANGLDVLKQLKREYPALRILVLSMYPEEQYAVRALKAGASGYLTKESTPRELIQAIRRVWVGRKYVSASLAERLAFTLEGDAERPLHETLSDREVQVMCGIASGRTGKELAEELLLSPKTISTYRSRVLRKMHMKSNAELTHYAIQNHLVE